MLGPSSQGYGDCAFVSEELETLAREHEGVDMRFPTGGGQTRL